MLKKMLLIAVVSMLLLSMGSLVLASDQSGEGSSPAQDRSCAIDLMLVLDSSGSISYEDFEVMRQWASDLVERFTLGPDAAQVGVIQFSGWAQLESRLTDDGTSINRAIQVMAKMDDGTDIYTGLLMAHEQFMSYGREDAPRVIIVLTDGQDGSTQTIPFAETIRVGEELGGKTTILGVAVGDMNLEQLNAITGGEFNVTQVPDFESLQQILSILHDYSCAVATEGTVSSTGSSSAETSSIQPATAVPTIAATTNSTAGTSSTNPTAQPTVTPMPTSVPVAAGAGGCTIHSIITERVNMRTGPGLGEVWLGFLPAGREHEVIGQAKDWENVTWWKLADGSWVRHDIVGETGDCDSVPVVAH